MNFKDNKSESSSSLYNNNGNKLHEQIESFNEINNQKYQQTNSNMKDYLDGLSIKSNCDNKEIGDSSCLNECEINFNLNNISEKSSNSSEKEKHIFKERDSSKKITQNLKKKRLRSPKSKNNSGKLNDNYINENNKNETKRKLLFQVEKMNKPKATNDLNENQIIIDILEEDKKTPDEIKSLIAEILSKSKNIPKDMKEELKKIWYELLEKNFTNNTILEMYNNPEKYKNTYSSPKEVSYSLLYDAICMLKGQNIRKKNKKKKFKIGDSLSLLIEVIIKFRDRKEKKDIKLKKKKNKKEPAKINNAFINGNIGNVNEEEILNDDLNNEFNNNISENNINNTNNENPDINYSMTNNSTNANHLEENEKEIRPDNLFKVLINMLVNFFKEQFLKESKLAIKENKYEKIKINKKSILKDMNSDFTDIVKYISGDNYINLVKNLIKESLNLMKMKKIDFLKSVIEKDDFFKNDREEQRTYYKNFKCKKMAIKILDTRNLDGLIRINKYITKEKGKYMKIKKREEFVQEIKTFVDENFSLELIKEETYINNRKDELKKIAKALIKEVEEKTKINGYDELNLFK